MPKVLLSILLAISFTKTLGAQQTTGNSTDTADQAKKEVMKIEEEKIAGLHKGVAATEEWFKRYNADDMAHTDPGSGMRTKAQVIADFDSGKEKVVPIKTSGYNLRVYNNGNTVVLTYRNTNNLTVSGKTSTGEHFSTDVYVKEKGAWKRVVHHSSLPPKE